MGFRFRCWPKFMMLVMQWKKKCLKIGEARNHLRQAVKILQERSEEVEAQNSNLKKGNFRSFSYFCTN